MSAFSPPRPSLWIQAVLVALVAWIAVMLLCNRVTWADWSSPHWLEGDPLEVYARIKIASEQPAHALASFTHIDRLGAPAGADWSAYPVPDRLVFTVTGLLARLTGVIAAVHLMSTLLAALNAVSFYLTARWLRWRWEWAVALGLVFALCNYNIRWGITLSLGQTFAFPPLVLLCARAGRRGHPPDRNPRWNGLAAALGLWLGLGNPYLAYFAGVVAGGAALLAGFRRSSWQRIVPLAVFLGVLSVVFLASNVRYAWHLRHGPEAGALLRSVGDLQVYALRPMEWLVPPADHRLPGLAGLGRAYQSYQHGAGEFSYNYLGVLGVAGLLGLLAHSARQLARGRWRKIDAALGLLWIIAFGVVGGINYWLGVAGLDLFRASTRIGIFGLIWVLLFLGGWISRTTRRLPRVLSLFLAGAVAVVACWEQTTPLADRTVRRRNFARWQHYQDAMEALAQALPSHAAIFQLPAVPFPEAGRTGGMPDYEHLLPYLTSRTLRFSYGSLRTSPATRWARHISRQPVPVMLGALEHAGFSALWLDQRAYADGGQALLGSMQELGYTEMTPRDSTLPVRIFRLHESNDPRLPDYQDPRLQDPWDEPGAIPGQPSLLASHGWYALETGGTSRWRWAARKATLGIWWDGGPTRARLRFRFANPGGAVVALQHEGREIWRAAASPDLQDVEIPLAAGLTTLDWQLRGATFRPGRHDPRDLGFMVENLSVSVP